MTVDLHVTNDGVATLTLNRPEKHNAFDDAIIAMLIEHLHQLDTDKQVRVVCLEAQGKNFSAGADLAWMQRMVDYSMQENLADAKQLALLMRMLDTLSKPTVALVDGAAYGGGVGLVACCDIVFATPNARFCFSEVKVGLVPAVIAPYVVRAIGLRNTRRYFLTAEIFNASVASDLGLVSEIVEPEQLIARRDALCERLNTFEPATLAECKKLWHRVADSADESLDDELASLIANIRISAASQRALRRFLQGR